MLMTAHYKFYAKDIKTVEIKLTEMAIVIIMLAIHYYPVVFAGLSI